MKRFVAHSTLVVKDYDEAIDFFIKKLDFILIEDTVLNATKRWVLVAPAASAESCILLAKAADKKQQLSIGNQTGGRVAFFLYTENFQKDFTRMVANGVDFVREPKTEPYGMVAVFKDLYGNLWDLLEPTNEF